MNDQEILRSLASQVRAIAERPVMHERRQLWLRHNALQPTRPLVVCSPEGAWGECPVNSALQCTDEQLRGWEWWLRAHIYTADVLRDDQVIEPFFAMDGRVERGAIRHDHTGPPQVRSTNAAIAQSYLPEGHVRRSE